MKVKNLFVLSVLLFAISDVVFCAEQVWRYVDDSGHVSYSNVQIKGKKGERVDIMSYPINVPSIGGVSGGIPIPADILKKLQPTSIQESGHAVRPPSGLPPLPTLPMRDGSGFSSAKKEISDEPKWAKEVAGESGVSPQWAKDPFSQH